MSSNSPVLFVGNSTSNCIPDGALITLSQSSRRRGPQYIIPGFYPHPLVLRVRLEGGNITVYNAGNTAVFYHSVTFSDGIVVTDLQIRGKKPALFPGFTFFDATSSALPKPRLYTTVYITNHLLIGEPIQPHRLELFFSVIDDSGIRVSILSR